MTAVELPSIEDHQELLGKVAELRGVVEQLVELVRTMAHPPLTQSAAQAAKYTGLSPKALAKLRTTGQLTWHDIEGSHRYATADLDRVIATRTASPPDQARRLRAVT